MTNDTDIALLKQHIETQDKDLIKLEERQKERFDKFEIATDVRFNNLEAIHKKIMYGIVLGVMSFLAWFGKIVLGKIGL
jgi:hypothetical protein